MVTHIQYSKIQMQHQAVPVSDISLSKVNSHNIFVSSDLAPDLDPFQEITRVFSKTIYKRNKMVYNYMIAQIQNFNLQMQLQAVPVSNLSLSKVTPQNIFVSSDVDPDLDPVQAITWIFNYSPNLDPHTSRLQTQSKFITPLSCDIKPDITNTNSQKIFVSADLDPDIDPVQAITWVFSKPPNNDPYT